jgi:hypothetical protein
MSHGKWVSTLVPAPMPNAWPLSLCGSGVNKREHGSQRSGGSGMAEDATFALEACV